MDVPEWGRWEWRDLFASDVGPPDPSTRLVLFVLAIYMNEHGEKCFPSQQTIAARTGLSERSVRNHLQAAEKLGWLKIYLRPRKGQSWFSHEYMPTIPRALAKLIKSKPWLVNPAWERPANSAGSSPEKAQHPANGAQRPATLTEHPANDDTTPGNLRHDTRQPLPMILDLNSSSNSSLNKEHMSVPQQAAAPTVLKKVLDEKAESRAAKERVTAIGKAERIRKALEKLPTWADADIAKATGSTLADVQNLRRGVH